MFRRIYDKYWWSNRTISYAIMLCQGLFICIVGFGFAWLVAPPIIREEIEQEIVWLFLIPMSFGVCIILAHVLAIKHVRKRFRYTVDKCGKKKYYNNRSK